MKRGRRLTSAFFEAPTKDLARRLIGCCLVSEVGGKRTLGRIVETEAYLSTGDPASHSHRGRTERNAAMFEGPGTAYVYLIYGMHLCLNVVSARKGVGEAVLLRALEPLDGLELMARRRGRERARDLCSGPAKLTQALGVTREHDGGDLRRGAIELWSPESFGKGTQDTPRILAGPRIGISKAVELPLRFSLQESPWVSR